MISCRISCDLYHVPSLPLTHLCSSSTVIPFEIDLQLLCFWQAQRSEWFGSVECYFCSQIKAVCSKYKLQTVCCSGDRLSISAQPQFADLLDVLAFLPISIALTLYCSISALVPDKNECSVHVVSILS